MLLVFGSVNLDIAFRADRLPAAGETVMGSGYLVSPGGKGANQAHAARLFGAPVTLAAAVGRDAFAEPALARLATAGCELGTVQRLDAPTGCAGIVVDARGENQIVVAPGANLALCSHHVDDATLATAHTVLLQMETDPAQNTVLLARARAAGCQTILNNAPARRLAPEVLALLDLLVVNETELAATLEGAGIQAEDARTQVEQVEMLAARFEMAVVLTLGAKGVLACAEGRVHEVASFPVDAVDTTGAGDTFTGVLAAARMEGQDWPLALRTAAAAAALACTKAGAQVAQPTRAEVNALLASSA
ncbi:MAG: ribokinase [Ramlibacter sp.]|uniref:ribokinase n=1 Tax=Ramlibacter sp. TaxID=1917967 RepID=UPI00260627CA|nr:ribokinase [Ramlibacter sp.]MDH4375391.1 ribokinase [Ramlibacter sp.]